MALKIYMNGQSTVTTAATRVQAATAATPISSIAFQAASGNTNGIYIGDVTVTSANGIRLTAGQVFTFSGDNRKGFADELVLSDFYFDSDTNGNKITTIYVKSRN